MALSPEERFALETYADPALTTAQKLERLQGVQPIGAYQGGGEMTPIGGYTGGAQMTPLASEIPPVPSGPSMDPAATAQMDPRAAAAMGAEAGRPPVAPRPDFTPAPPSIDVSRLPTHVAPPPPIAEQRAQLRRDLLANKVSQADYEAREADLAKASGETQQPEAVDPSQVQFAGAPGAPQAPPRPQYAVVGTDTFQPVQRTIRGGVDPTVIEPGPPGEPEFAIAGTKQETVVDPATGKLITRTVPAGLAIGEGEPGPPTIRNLESEIQQAEGDRDQAARDTRAGVEYADAANLRRQAQAEVEIREIERERIAQESERLRKLEEKQAQFQQVMAEVTDPDNPVENFWASKSDEDKIFGRIGLFFGTLGSAKLGVKNEQLELLKQEIDASVQAQKNAKEQKVRGAQTAYDMSREIFSSEAARDAATREAAYAKVMRDLERFKSFAQTPERQAQLDMAIAELDKERAMSELARKQAMEGEISMVERFDPKRSVQVNSGKLKEDHRKRLVRLPDGSFAFSRDPVRTEKIQDQITVDASIVRSANRIKRLREQPGAKTDPKVRAQISGAAADLFLALKSGANLGTLDKGSLEFRDEWIGKPNDLIDFGGADALLNEVGRAADARVRDTLSSKLDRDPDQPSPVIDNVAPSTAVRGAVR